MTHMHSTRSRTAQYTDLYFDEEIVTSLKSAKAELKLILESVRDCTATFTYVGQIVTALPSDFPRMLAEWSTKSSVHHALRNIITSALFSAEEKCSGAALVAAGAWVSDAEVPAQVRKRSTKLDVDSCLKYFGGSGMARATADAVIDLGGIGCNVEYDETRGDATRVISFRGHRVYGDIEQLFGDRIGRNFDLHECAVVAVDGAVESVATIHRLLEASSEKDFLVIAGSFLPDVSNTMAETWKVGRGRCIPFIVRDWGVPNFLDLEKMGFTCISNDRGDTFAGLKIESLQSRTVNVEPDSCTISGGPNEVTSKIVVEVSQSLGGLTGLAKDRVKTLVGYARQCSRSGVVKWEMLSESSPNFSALYSKELAISSSSLAAGSKAKASMEKVLRELGCLILHTKGDTK